MENKFRFTAVIAIFIAAFLSVKCQNVTTFIDQTNIDSLTKTIRIISGEDSVLINNKMRIIQDRVYDNSKLLTQYYIRDRFANYNLQLDTQRIGYQGINLYAIQKGYKYPDSVYMICAHYDAVSYHCADDNGSGVAAVIEAARILSQYKFEYTIIYAFWDLEENGLVGSKYYAKKAAAKKENISGVINLDMIAYDDDNDGSFDIHTQNTMSSLKLLNNLLYLLNITNIDLNPIIINPGTDRSDHYSFWLYNYGAIAFGETIISGGGNKYYHTPDDRVKYFNMNYFRKITSLGIGLLAASAHSELGDTNVATDKGDDLLLYPNPTNKFVNIYYKNTDNLKYDVYDELGNKILLDKKSSNPYQIDLESVADGIYFVKIDIAGQITTKLVIKNSN